jgi:hypothetical protein
MAGALLNAAAFGGYAWVASHYGPEIDSWQMVVPLAPVTTSRRTPTSAMAAVITRVRSASRCHKGDCHGDGDRSAEQPWAGVSYADRQANVADCARHGAVQGLCASGAAAAGDPGRRAP